MLLDDIPHILLYILISSIFRFPTVKYANTKQGEAGGIILWALLTMFLVFVVMMPLCFHLHHLSWLFVFVQVCESVVNWVKRIGNMNPIFCIPVGNDPDLVSILKHLLLRYSGKYDFHWRPYKFGQKRNIKTTRHMAHVKHIPKQ